MKTTGGRDVMNEVFAGLVPPVPPEKLKDDVLRASQEAWQNRNGESLWTRLWYHRGLRVVWTGAVALLLIGHIFLPTAPSARLVVAVDTRPDALMAEFLRPTRIAASATPNLGRFQSETTLSMGGIG
jgi:hypothetical protein